MIVGPSYWDRYPQAFDVAKAMWKAGKSSGVIANQLSRKFDRITRSAVMGKMNRHGLVATNRRGRHDTLPTHPPNPKPNGHCKKLRIKEELIVDEPVPLLPAPGSIRDLPVERPSTMVSLYNVTAAQCRWPAGEAYELMFCGAPIKDDASYSFCTHHMQRATTRYYRDVNHVRIPPFRYR